MQELLDHPAVQAAVLPFAVALMVAFALARTRWLGLAIVAGFLCTAGLAVGFTFESLTAVRKLLLVAIAGAMLVAVLEGLADRALRFVLVAWCAFAIAAVPWVLMRLLGQLPLQEALLKGIAAVAWCLALLWAAHRTRHDPVAAPAASMVVGLAAGAIALLGASAQLAQLGIALAAGAGAVLAVVVLRDARSPVGALAAQLPYLLAGLVALLAVMTGQVPWYCLVPLPLIPWLATLAPAVSRPAWQRAPLYAFTALGPALAAGAIAWFTAGS